MAAIVQDLAIQNIPAITANPIAKRKLVIDETNRILPAKLLAMKYSTSYT